MARLLSVLVATSVVVGYAFSPIRISRNKAVIKVRIDSLQDEIFFLK